MTKKQAQEYLGFQIKRPTYVVKGYKFTGEDIQTPLAIKKMDPTIVYEYRNEDSVYMVYQSAVRDQGEDSLKGIVGTSEKITNYELVGTKISLSENTKDKFKVIKMIVPAKGKNNTYQVTILADNLSKEELEKIMLSCLK
ncbi:beta-lactamase regulatory protein (plasmid) [Bacillus thuringiensis serovar indiana]|nr:beta-lactamase regulatory protein [Bacillus thuringiensis serovar indiana]